MSRPASVCPAATARESSGEWYASEMLMLYLADILSAVRARAART
eukprot:CAMPEP_0204079734 /NCGR_PEP_ID=MMETSP0360-20130528/172857_1 /ASSEMBLY_ACC=CAM_ASM_000342 /TAXON_ID=268821 /ORGANISM="Scrippsiella Hangoei, Strain SHTV-5" /LENGTH=44 /DNA_ID= /DNA_START= /DNA_END= /DNA_ORIENTATION=